MRFNPTLLASAYGSTFNHQSLARIAGKLLGFITFSPNSIIALTGNERKKGFAGQTGFLNGRVPMHEQAFLCVASHKIHVYAAPVLPVVSSDIPDSNDRVRSVL